MFQVLRKRGGAWSGGALAGWDYRKEFTVSRASGAVTDYQIKLEIAESSVVGTQVNACEATTGWFVVRSTIATDTGTEGTYSLKITATEDDGYAYDTFDAEDWSAMNGVTFQHKRSGVETGGEFFVQFSGSWNNFAKWGFAMSDDWTIEEIDLNSPDSTGGTVNWAAVTGIRFDANASGTVLWLDDVRRHIEIPNVNAEAHVASSFNDIRFTKSDGTTTLPYYIESISGTTPNQLATARVKLDSVGTSETTFYMYYGKADALAGSSGADTFIFFDDFSGDSLDTDKWDAQAFGSNAVSSGYLRVWNTTSGSNPIGVITDGAVVNPSSGNIAIDAVGYKRTDAGSQDWFAPLGIYYDLNNQCWLGPDGETNKKWRIYKRVASEWTLFANAVGVWAFDTEYRLTFTINEGTINGYYNGNLIATGTYSVNQDHKICYFKYDGTNHNLSEYVSTIFARKFYVTEPVIVSWGNEEGL